MYWARQQRGAVRVFRTRSKAMNPHIKLIDDRTAVAPAAISVHKNRQTDRRPDRCVNVVTKFQHEQREPER